MNRVMSSPLSKASNQRRSTVSTITYQGDRKHTLVDNDAKGGLFVNPLPVCVEKTCRLANLLAADYLGEFPAG